MGTVYNKIGGGDTKHNPQLLTRIGGNGSYTYTGSDKASLTVDNFLFVIDYCSISNNMAITFDTTQLASRSYNPSTGVFTVSNMVKYQHAGSTPLTATFSGNLYLCK